MLSDPPIDSQAEEAFLAECREKDTFLDTPGVRREKQKTPNWKKRGEEEIGNKHLTLEEEVMAVYKDYNEGRPA